MPLDLHSLDSHSLDPHLSADELTRLADSPDPATRRAVAAHPNTPAPVLGRLGAEFPDEVLANPALPLLRLAEPGLLRGWPAVTLERMTAAPGVPDWLLTLAAQHAKIDVQLAAVTRPALPPAALQALAESPFWTIREYVARKPSLPPEVLRWLALDADYGVRLTIAGRADLPPDLRETLRRDPHPLVQAVILLGEG